MTRSFAMWAGSATVLAVVVAAATVASFPREPRAVELPAIFVLPRPAARPPVPVSLQPVQVARTTAIATAIRGGASALPRAARDVGNVGFARTTTSLVPSRTKRVAAVPAAKRAAKRQASIGATSAANGDNGLAATRASNVGASSRGPAPAPGVG